MSDVFTVNIITFTRSGFRARKWPLLTNDQHSFLLCIISKATWRTKRAFFTTESSGWCLGLLPVFAATLARFFSLRAAWLKATCYTLSLTHTHSYKHTYTHTDLHKSCCDYTSKSSDRNLV